MATRWNDGALNALKELFAAGKPLDAITQEMNSQFGTNHTPNAIYCKLHGLGLKFRGSQIFWQEAETDFLISLFGDPAGMSYGVIAVRLTEKFGVTFSRSAVIARAIRLGLKSKDRNIRLINSAVRPERAAPKKPDTEMLRCVEIEPRHLSLIDLEKGDCRYPYGDGPMTFCGHPIKEGSSYCVPHHHMCWVRPIATLPKARVYHGTDFSRGAA